MSKSPYLIVAEDDPFYRKIYKKKCEREGMEVTIAENGLQVIEAVKTRKPDLILMDLLMSEMDGYETLKHLQENPENAGIKVLIMSNLGQTEDLERSKALGASDFIIKADVSIHDAFERIHKHLASA